MMGRPLLILLLSAGVASAQEKPLPDPQRSLQVGEQRPAALPAFDLPEFVITGRESIDLPVAEKQNIPGDRPGRAQLRPGGSPVVRESPSVSGGSLPRARVEGAVRRTGRAYIGLGSFSAFQTGVELSGFVDDLHLGGEASYETMKGSEAHADLNDVRAGVRASSPVSLFSALLDRSRARASAGIGRRSYKWYGSSFPATQRAVSDGEFEAGLSGAFLNGSQGILSLGYSGGAVTDSSAFHREHALHIGGTLDALLAGMPTETFLDIISSSRTGDVSGSYGGLTAGTRIEWSPVPFLTTRFSASIASVWGEIGQKRTMFIPGFYTAFRITPEHQFFGKYEPGVRFQGLISRVTHVPYLHAEEPIRHVIFRNRGTLGLESDWGSGIRTAFSIEASTMSDYPIVADTGRSGVYRVFYGDATETLLKGSVVAKLPANHYFSAIAIVRSSKNSTSGLSVPYLPTSEVRVHYRNPIADQLEVGGTIQAVSGREVSVSGSPASLAGYVRCDLQVTYLVVQGLKAWASMLNVLDAHIEHWVGYKERPFTLSIGASYVL